MAVKECTHKTASDFIVEQSSVAGRRLWKCSGCGLVGAWQPDWMYYGNVECPHCQETAIDAVYCGSCVKSVDLKKPPPRGRRQQARSR